MGALSTSVFLPLNLKILVKFILRNKGSREKDFPVAGSPPKNLQQAKIRSPELNLSLLQEGKSVQVLEPSLGPLNMCKSSKLEFGVEPDLNRVTVKVT